MDSPTQGHSKWALSFLPIRRALRETDEHLSEMIEDEDEKAMSGNYWYASRGNGSALFGDHPVNRIGVIMLLGMWGAVSGCYRASSGEAPSTEAELDRSTADGDADIDTDTGAKTETETETDTDTDCTNVTPCGGDTVGTWNVTSSCLTVSGALNLTSMGLMHCPSAPITGALEVTGTWTADVDGTYFDSTTTTGSVRIDLPHTCQEFDGSCIGCDRFGRVLASVGYTSVTCEDDPNPAETGYCGGGCICAGTVDEAAGVGVVSWMSATGAYTTADSTLTVSETWVDQAYAYCVFETTLTMTPLSTDLTGTLTGVVELQKQ